VERYYESLARLGFNVFIYDQIGSGHSARLDDPREYTVDRHIRDLEAIRQLIGAKKLILIGDSWGATLAANYMAEHPDRCAKVIFSGPGSMEPSPTPSTYPDAPMTQSAEAFFARIYSRYPNLQQLIDADPVAAHRAAPDKEMDPQLDALVQSSLPYVVCDPKKLPADLNLHGHGWWVNTMVALDLNRHPRHIADKLKRNQTPVLILRGGCDYLRWQVAWQYKQTFPNSKLIYVPNAGHAFGFDQPEIYVSTVKASLLDQPLPIAPYTSTAEPPRVMPSQSFREGK
jgi:pimeloyl-ACP methyl ester carboxylesterase